MTTKQVLLLVIEAGVEVADEQWRRGLLIGLLVGGCIGGLITTFVWWAA